MRIGNSMKLAMTLSLIAVLVFTSALFSVLLYAEWTGKELMPLSRKLIMESVFNAEAAAKGSLLSVEPQPAAEHIKKLPIPAPEHPLKKEKANISVPIIHQRPELPAGCEITSLAMLLRHYGLNINKMDLVPEMTVDPTPIMRRKDGTIKYWGNPNIGFVGDITGKNSGFAIYHGALFDLLKKHVKSGVDLTGGSFDELEQQLSAGMPVVVWTTTTFTPPKEWIEWDTPLGPFRTTFKEHAVLLVGYDKENVYINDPLSGNKNLKLNKIQFIETWEVMGKQALSYKEKR